MKPIGDVPNGIEEPRPRPVLCEIVVDDAARRTHVLLTGGDVPRFRGVPVGRGEARRRDDALDRRGVGVRRGAVDLERPVRLFRNPGRLEDARFGRGLARVDRPDARRVVFGVESPDAVETPRARLPCVLE